MKNQVATVAILLTLALGAHAASATHTELSDTLKYQRDSLFIDGLKLKQLRLADSAYVSFSKAAAIDATNPAINYELGMSNIGKDINLSVEYLQKAVDASENNYYYLKSLIKAQLMAGNTTSAIDGYEKLLKKFPDHEADYCELADLYTRTGASKKAIKTYERLERITGTDRYISLSKVNNYLLLGNVKTAHKELDKLIKEMPLDASLWAYKGDIHTDSKEMDKAAECYARANEIDPENGYVLESTYVYYIRMGEFSKADETLKKIFSSNEIPYRRKKQYLNQTIKYYTTTGKPLAELDTIYQCILTSEPENSDAMLEYASHLTSTQRTDEAIENLRTAVYVDPSCENCWDFLLSLVASKDDSLQIENTIKDAMDAIPQSATFMFYKGVWEQYKQQDQIATESFLRADSIVTLNPKALREEQKRELWTYLFETYYKQGDREKYYKYLDKCVDAFPNDIMALNNYAYMIAVDNGDLEKAQAMSKKTIDKEPLSPTYLDTYAYILMKMGNYTHARFYIEQAIEYMKSNPDAIIYEHYGDILYHAGDVDGAVEQWQKAQNMNQADRVSKTLQYKIKNRKYEEF